MGVLELFPETFPNKGRYRRWSASWQPDGYADTAQYPGQMPVTFPEDASPLECALGGYLRGATNG